MLIKVFVTFALSLSLGACLVESPAGKLEVGHKAPLLRTKYINDVEGDMSRLTTYRYPDERMYQYSIDQALKLNKPVVVEFATPGHCTVCDKQLQMLKAMVEKYGSDVVFLHMDQYKNPEAFIAFDVKGDPWTFVLDRNNVVRFKRAGRLLYNELDVAIRNAVVIDEG